MSMVHKGGNAVPFHGDHHPVSIYVGSQPIFEPIDQAQGGKTLTFENTYNDAAEVTVFGESTQDGEPTPEAPVPIESIKSVELVSSNADGSKSATRIIDLQGHELRSLPDGTHDEVQIRRDGSVVFVKRIGEDNAASGFYWSGSSSYGRTIITSMLSNRHSGNNTAMGNNGNALCDRFVQRYNYKTVGSFFLSPGKDYFAVSFICDENEVVPDTAKSWILKNNPTVTYALATPTETVLGTIDPLPTYHPYTVVDGNGADISARVRVFE